MPLFAYQAVDIRGTPHAGELESGDRVAALDLLQQRGLTPIALSEHGDRRTSSVRTKLLSWRTRPAKSLDSARLVSVTQSLAALLKAGMTIDRAITLTGNLSSHDSSGTWLNSLGSAVRNGKSFADALLESGVALPVYYVGMVRAGETGGSLAQTLGRLADLLRRQFEVRERIRSALIYPSLLGCIVLLTIVLLITVVLPRFNALFAEAETQLPLATRIVLGIGAFVSGYWWALTAVLAVAVLAAARYVRSPTGRAQVDGWLLTSRFTLGLPAAIDTGRLLRTLSTLLTNGVQIGPALRISRSTLVNTRLRKGLDEAAQRIKAGESISRALHATGVFPAEAVQLARVGEESGRLEELLAEAASVLEYQSSTSLDRLLALLVPSLTIMMGLLIAGLIGSILIGLLSINDLAF